MKIGEDLKLSITRLEEATDKDGYVFLKAKGYHSYKFVTQGGRTVKGYDQFTSIRLRPINETQFQEAQNRLFNQKVDKPQIKIVAYDCELNTNNIGGKLCAILEVKRWDFTSRKLFRKKDLLQIGKENE